MYRQVQTLPPEKDIYTVSRLNAEAKRTLETQWTYVWLTGEISGLTVPSSGHWYFKLKDARAQVSCAMFRSSNTQVQTQVQSGMQVLVLARVSLYEARGDFQLIIERLSPAGDGALQLQYEALKQRLFEAGLFAQSRKIPLPASIQTLGMITSLTGAALQDVLAILKRRDPSIRVIIYPALVQGQEAPASLLAALNHAVTRQEVDALLITRGGGSMEDLWCFNDEQFVRAVAQCPIPTMSAVGHEIDHTLTDFVTSVRAPTPSAAAELLSAEQVSKQQNIDTLKQRLQQAWRYQSSGKQHQWQRFNSRLPILNPQRKIESEAQRLDELDLKLIRSTSNYLAQKQQMQLVLAQRLKQQSPQRQLKHYQERLYGQEGRLKQAISSRLKQAQTTFHQLQKTLILTSPLNTLERGYSLTLAENQQIIRSTRQVKVGQQITTRLGQGKITSRIESIQEDGFQSN